jgi:hypothetical protein
MNLFIRFFVVSFGIFFASLAAGATFLATANGFSADLDAMPYGDFFFWNVMFSMFWSAIFFYWAGIPILIGVLLTEMLAIRSALIYAVAGGIGGALYGVGFLLGIQNAVQSSAAAGIMGGLVYWLVAGRTAGAWRGANGRAIEKI